MQSPHQIAFDNAMYARGWALFLFATDHAPTWVRADTKGEDNALLAKDMAEVREEIGPEPSQELAQQYN